MIYANSVFGARTNYEGGMASFAAAITGRTPAYGFHLDEVRHGSIPVEVRARMRDTADRGALGKIVGHPNQVLWVLDPAAALKDAASNSLS